jgi:hypothetical protein
MNVPTLRESPTLEQASQALWAATLSLMTAFMQHSAPAHRLLLARRIAANFQTLCEQECFSARTRDSFSRLARRWQDHATRLDPQAASSGWTAFFKPAWLRGR